MKKFYLVDLENVKNSGLDGIDQLSPADRVIVFYSDKADTLKIDIIQKISEGKAAVTFIKADNGTPNSLDFQLITYLYYHLAKEYSEEDQYWIISKDTGYEASIRMAKKLGLNNVRRAPAIINAVHYQVRMIKSTRTINAENQTVKEEAAAEDPLPADAEVSKEELDAIEDDSSYAGMNDNLRPQKEVSGESESSDQWNEAAHALLKDKCSVDIDAQHMDLIEKALRTTDNKNQFYQYFRRHMGAKEGSRFYKSIRSQYAALREIAGL